MIALEILFMLAWEISAFESLSEKNLEIILKVAMKINIRAK